MKKKEFKEFDWVVEETNEPVIIDGIALRDIKEGEHLVSYGKVLI